MSKPLARSTRELLTMKRSQVQVQELDNDWETFTAEEWPDLGDCPECDEPIDYCLGHGPYRIDNAYHS